MTQSPLYLLENGRVSLGVSPLDLSTAEMLAHYIDSVDADLEAMKRTYVDGIAGRKVSIVELRSDQARARRPQLYRSMAVRRLRALQAGA